MRGGRPTVEREAFLARVAASVRSAQVPPHGEPGLLVPELPETDLVQRFTASLTAVDGVVHDDPPARVLGELIDRYQPKRFLAWAGLDDLTELLSQRGVEQVPSHVPIEDRLAHQGGYLDVDLGLTGAEAGFAESGSIVVRSGPGQPRMASLIPLVHVALLPKERIFRSLAHWAKEEAATVAAASNLVFITGPSRTGDIEQYLNLGVHGPKHVHVVLV